MKQKLNKITLLLCAAAMAVMCSCTKDNSNNGNNGGNNNGGGNTYNNHAYVDLGLPSGTLWATCNVGANMPEGYGSYFAWGETAPKETYNWTTYKWCSGNVENNGVCYELTKYCSDSFWGLNGFHDNLTELLPEDDAATANWGSGWCTPTAEQWVELFRYTTCINSYQNNVNGRVFTSANGNSIFLPYAGRINTNGLNGVGQTGVYWSKGDRYYPSDGLTVSAGGTHINTSGWEMGPLYYDRYEGLSVRPVRSSN